MKSLISLGVATAVVAFGLAAGPTTGRAQTPTDGATPTPTMSAPAAASPVPVEARPTDPTAAQPAPGPRASEDANPDETGADEIVVREEREHDIGSGHGSGGRNIVFVLNRSDERMRVRGRIRLVEAHGTRAEPVNAAFAYASCTDCQTFAVALEIALVSPEAATIAPQNRARAINYECTRCTTVARALQYVFVVDDPDAVPDNIRRLMREMERELRGIGGEPDITAEQANARVSAVVADFQDLAEGLQDELATAADVTSPGAPSPAEAPSSE
jgi:putative peptide zinc metalloprotease protein